MRKERGKDQDAGKGGRARCGVGVKVGAGAPVHLKPISQIGAPHDEWRTCNLEQMKARVKSRVEQCVLTKPAAWEVAVFSRASVALVSISPVQLVVHLVPSRA